MPDLESKTQEKVDVTAPVNARAGTRLQIIVGSTVVLDRTVPAGKNLRGYVILQGDLVTQ